MKNETKDWIYFADSDIHIISNNINTEDPEATGAIAVFCQQATEKYFMDKEQSLENVALLAGMRQFSPPKKGVRLWSPYCRQVGSQL